MLSLRDVLVVWFVRRETDASCAAIAAAIVSLNAISLTYAGIMIPDPLMSLLMFASGVALYEGIRPTVRRRSLLVMLAGALAAMSYSAKDPGILVAAPSMLFIVATGVMPLRERARLAVLYVAGLVAVTALESLAYYVVAGDFLYRSHALSSVHNATIVEMPDLMAFVHAVYWNLRLVTTPVTASTQVLIASAIVFVAALVTRSRLAFFSLSGLFIGSYLIFGTSSLTRLMPLPVQARPDMPFFVSPMLHRMIEPFVSPELFATLKPMEGVGPVRGFYLAHPWEADRPTVPLLAAMKHLPVVLVIDEEQRFLGRYAIEAMPTDRKAIVHVKFDD